MAFQFFSNRVTLRQYVSVVRCSIAQWATSSALTSLSSYLFNMAAGGELFAAGAVVRK